MVVQSKRGMQRKQIKSLMKTAVFLTAVLGFAAYYKVVGMDEAVGDSGRRLREVSAPAGDVARSLAEDKGDPMPLANQTSYLLGYGYPIQPDRPGYTFLYILGVLYLFLGIAIVCDEFFVPALTVLMNEVGVSPEVGGATFMAAGGSAPELFTSLIGTFKRSTVGFGTIIGSAVFNVLFVIGMCALFSKETLVLTWWPLARDSTYYAISLLVLAMFFHDEVIMWWEALVLFGMYFGYVTVMKYNEFLHKKIDSWVHQDAPPAQLDSEKSSRGIGGPNIFLTPGTFRAGVLTHLISDDDFDTSLQRAMVSQVKGDLKSTFDKIDKDSSGKIDKSELKELFDNLHLPSADEDVQRALNSIKKDDDEQISFEEFTGWYQKAETKIEQQICNAFQAIDTDGDGYIDRPNIENLIRKLAGDATSGGRRRSSVARRNSAGRASFTAGSSSSGGGVEMTSVAVAGKKKFTDGGEQQPGENAELSPREAFEAQKVEGQQVAFDVDEIWGQAVANAADKSRINKEEFSSWYETSFFYSQHMDAVAGEDDEEWEPLDISFPEGTLARINWVILAPLLYSLHFTCPDVRTPGMEKWFPVTFVGAITWIGVYSFFMVEWATMLGEGAGIPDNVMGLTILAAGTSIPDLLTSVIVARQGHGDMAVSSSIGSNIFDVLVGLPVPWLLYCAIDPHNTGYRVYVTGAESIFASILILFGMLVSVITIIKCNHWRMTKGLGISMFFLYIIFIIQDLLRSLG